MKQHPNLLHCSIIYTQF